MTNEVDCDRKNFAFETELYETGIAMLRRSHGSGGMVPSYMGTVPRRTIVNLIIYLYLLVARLEL